MAVVGPIPVRIADMLATSFPLANPAACLAKLFAPMEEMSDSSLVVVVTEVGEEEEDEVVNCTGLFVVELVVVGATLDFRCACRYRICELVFTSSMFGFTVNELVGLIKAGIVADFF